MGRQGGIGVGHSTKLDSAVMMGKLVVEVTPITLESILNACAWVCLPPCLSGPDTWMHVGYPKSKSVT